MDRGAVKASKRRDAPWGASTLKDLELPCLGTDTSQSTRSP